MMMHIVHRKRWYNLILAVRCMVGHKQCSVYRSYILHLEMFDYQFDFLCYIVFKLSQKNIF